MTGLVEDPPDWSIARVVLDSLDTGVLVLQPDLERELLRNPAATRLLGAGLPEAILDAVRGYVTSRRDLRRMPPPVRLEVGDHVLYLRVVRGRDEAPLEIVLMNEEVLRDADVFRLLNERHGVTRREYQVLCGMRVGKTNKQIASELNLAVGTVELHVHHLLTRFSVANRTGLVKVVGDLLLKRT
jgi:DNA-binding CsgD family transcriptional regulator